MFGIDISFIICYLFVSVGLFVWYVRSCGREGKRFEDMWIASKGLTIGLGWPILLIPFLLSFVVDWVNRI